MDTKVWSIVSSPCSSGFPRLSWLTFNTSLVHAIVLNAIFVLQHYLFFYTDLNMSLLGTLSAVLSCRAASVVTFIVEFPIANVEMTFFHFVRLQFQEFVQSVDKESYFSWR